MRDYGPAHAVQATAFRAEAAQNETEIRILKPAKPIERELQGDGAHFYRIELISGQYARIVVDQRGVDVMVSVFGPDQKKILEVDSPNGDQGIEEVYLVAATPGDYRFEVRSVEKSAPAGKYEIRIEDLRTATAADWDRNAARQLYQEADDLAREGSIENRRIAHTKYEQALSIWRRLDDRRGEADALVSIGMNYNALKKNDEALIYFEESLPPLQALKDRPVQAIVLDKIGRIYSLFGDNQKALNANKQVVALTRELKDQAGEARSLSNVAITYFNLGETQRALYLFKEALLLQQAAKDYSSEPHTLNNIAKSYYLLGDTKSALEYFERALALYQKTDNRPGEAVIFNNIGNIHYDSGNIQKAMYYYQKALPIWEAFDNSSGQSRALDGIGRVYASIGEREKALDNYSRAIKLRRDAGDKAGEALITYNIALLERDRGNLSQAINLVESALATVESLRTKVASQDLRASFLGSKQAYYELYIDLLMQQHRLNPSAKYDLQALAASERSRARSLLEMLPETRAGIREGINPVLRSKERKLQQQINAKAAEHTALLNGRHTKQQAEAIAQQISALRNEYLQLDAEVTAKNPRYAALTQPQPLGGAELQRQVLDSDTLLLEYALGDERSYLWAVIRSSIFSIELPKRAKIESAARRMHDLLTARNRRPSGETIQQRRGASRRPMLNTPRRPKP